MSLQTIGEFRMLVGIQMKRIAKVIFDLDGTLSDPIEGITNSINYSLKEHGFEPIPVSAISKFIDHLWIIYSRR